MSLLEGYVLMSVKPRFVNTCLPRAQIDGKSLYPSASIATEQITPKLILARFCGGRNLGVASPGASGSGHRLQPKYWPGLPPLEGSTGEFYSKLSERAVCRPQKVHVQARL